jgi:integrase
MKDEHEPPAPAPNQPQAPHVPRRPGRPLKVVVVNKQPYVPAAIRKLQKEHSIGLRVLRHVIARHPGDPFAQLVEFFDDFRIPAATGRKRHVSYKTEDRYFNTLKRVLQTLRKPLNMQVQNLTDLSPRQARAVIRQWEAWGCSASTLAGLNTVLRRFGIWIGKPNLTARLAEVVANPELARRRTSALNPKSWESIGIDPEQVFTEAAVECAVTAMQLRLGWAFGLRVEEQLMLRPGEALEGNVLLLTYGTKGGLPRKIPIHHAWELALVERAKAMAEAHPKKILAARPFRDLKKARNHYYYVCRKVGLTQSGRFRSTPHGARHSFAVRRFEMQSGLAAPVLGGPAPPSEVDQAARQVVAKEMGHGRTSVTAAYLGTAYGMKAAAFKLHECMVKRNALLGNDVELREIASQARITTFLLVGAAATGEPLRDSTAMLFCAGKEPIPEEAMQAVLARVGHLLTAKCVLVDRRALNLPTFEVLAIEWAGAQGPVSPLQCKLDLEDGSS